LKRVEHSPQKFQRFYGYRLNWFDEPASAYQAGSGNYDGKPCVRDTRIPVYALLQKMAAGETEAELLKAYPQLSKADLTAVWEYAAPAVAEEILFAESRVRLLFDENLSVLSAQWVTSTLAVDVLDAPAAGLAGKTDQENTAVCH
jgi:uncharacterized protein (DUF433 family)